MATWSNVPRVMARGFSTSSASQQLVKAPIQLFGTNGRYATALYSAASKQKQLEQVEKDLKDIHGRLKQKGQLMDMLLNPSLKRGQKMEVIASAMAQTKASKLTANLLSLLAENGRLASLEGIAASYFTIMSAHRGEIECEVTTAKPLDGPLQQELEAALKAFVKPGQSIQIKSTVDPTIVGGMIVSIGDKYVDMSTASKIKKYTDLIQAAI
ncbi:ATP synthase subunit O, mitochondrial [Orchesella cincta]|uniref:Oligomycin sensitivity conferral protein n=1 Tax=Orchesella cincta TaxID=48709 RepID=A0A1D2NLJ1_ORCCI|nr:ATP synthase subunit O, mitochondrial [Orchesella cincta]